MMFKKALAIFLLVSVLLPTLAQPILAYDSTPGADEPTDLILDYYPEVFEPAIEAPEMNLESFVNETVKSLLWGVTFYYLYKSPLGSLHRAFYCGHSLENAIQCITDLLNQFGLLYSSAPSNQAYSIADETQSSGSLVSSLKTLKNVLKTRPVSTLRFFEWGREKLGFTSSAQAQGFGFDLLRETDTIINLWTVFRNAAYAFTAIGLIIAGFMIMFRMKLSPQTVVTIQSALPGVVMTLLLITFSYAIVGFILDLVWVFTILSANLLGASENLMEAITNDSAWGFFFDSAVMWKGLLVVFFTLGSSVSTILASLVTGVATIPLILFLILGIMMIITAIRILFMLVKAYVFIVLYTIVGPLWILLGVIPGVKGVGSWFKNILSHALVFPVTAALLVLAYRFMEVPSGDELLELLEQLIAGGGRPHLPLLGPMTILRVRAYLALGIIFFTPKIAATIQKAMRTLSVGEGFALIPGAGFIVSGVERGGQTWIADRARTYGGAAWQRGKQVAGGIARRVQAAATPAPPPPPPAAPKEGPPT